MKPLATGLALAAALLCSAAAAGGGGATAGPAPDTLALSCGDGGVTLLAREAPAPAVFRALERDCGLLLRRAELIPDRPVTIEVRKRPLEEAVADLVRLTGIPSTLSATSATEPLTLVLLPTGTGLMPRPAPGTPAEGEAPGEGAGDAGKKMAARRAEQERILERIAALDPAEQWVLEGLELDSLLRLRDDAASEDALHRLFAAKTEEERRMILEELRGIGPAPGTGAAWSPSEADNHRWRLEWQQAEREYLLAADDAARERALRALREANPEVLADLDKLTPEKLGAERTRAGVGTLRDRYLLLLSREEWETVYRARTPGPAAGGVPGSAPHAK